jgi:hypothetical protein
MEFILIHGPFESPKPVEATRGDGGWSDTPVGMVDRQSTKTLRVFRSRVSGKFHMSPLAFF